jgi:hypothetical protein
MNPNADRLDIFDIADSQIDMYNRLENGEDESEPDDEDCIDSETQTTRMASGTYRMMMQIQILSMLRMEISLAHQSPPCQHSGIRRIQKLHSVGSNGNEMTGMLVRLAQEDGLPVLQNQFFGFDRRKYNSISDGRASLLGLLR